MNLLYFKKKKPSVNCYKIAITSLKVCQKKSGIDSFGSHDQPFTVRKTGTGIQG